MSQDLILFLIWLVGGFISAIFLVKIHTGQVKIKHIIFGGLFGAACGFVTITFFIISLAIEVSTWWGSNNSQIKQKVVHFFDKKVF